MNQEAAQEHHARQPEELLKLKKFVETHGKNVAIMVIVVLAIVVTVNAVRSSKSNKIRLASASLGVAETVPALEAVISDHGATPAAPLALLRLAGMHYEAGNYEAALSKYTQFIADHPEHEFILGAEMGRIQCIEAKGQIAEALAAFAAFSSEHSDSYLHPEAVFGQGRCLRQLQRFKEARTVYEDFIAANPDSAWMSRAEEELAEVVAELEEKPDVSLSPIINLQSTGDQ